MNREQLIQIHDLVKIDDAGTYRDAAACLFEIAGHKMESYLSVEKSKLYLSTAFYSLLNQDQYIEAALLGWGKDQFNPEPQEVQRVFDALLKYPKNIFLGGATLGKSYSGTLFYLLDWARDPEYTNTKIISTTEGHAKANTWSTLLNFHRTCIIPLPGKPQAEFITIRPGDRQAAMGISAIPSGDDGKGRLQGFHPLPRPTVHPKFGKLTRVNAFLDEGEKIPIGVWDGIDNLLSAETPEGNVRITGATNPADISSMLAQRAEPEKGWQDVDPDVDFEWISRMGFHVVRLDPQYSANVVQKRVIYSGLQTYEGFMNFARMGKSNPSYWTFGRGMYPTENVEYNIIPPAHLKDVKKIYNFSSLPVNVASLDPAFAEGGDDAIITTGRYGMANGYLEGSTLIPFPEKPVLQIEQQFNLKKGNAQHMCSDLIEILKQLHVRPEYFVMDKTGNAWGLHDILKIQYGPDIIGILWGEDATEKKILQEDTATAKEQYSGITTEMWFAFSKWLEVGSVKFAPMMDTWKLFAQLSNRKFSPKGRLPRVESKADYKSHTKQSSPDAADSAIMLVHLCRIRATDRPAMLPQAPAKPRPSSDWEWFDYRKRPEDEPADAIPYIRI